MDEKTREIIEKVGDYSNVSMEQILSIAQAVQHADFSDENTVRRLVRQLAHVANQPISEEVENTIVESILQRSIPTSLDELHRYFR